MQKQKIGYLGGSFDPFHFGHLNLALEMLEKGGMDEIWICPTSLSPFKENQPPIAIKHRLKMIELAIEGISGLKLIDQEAKNEKISYTYLTLNALKNDPQNLNKSFTLILAGDLLQKLDQWYQAPLLLKEFSILVGRRTDQPLDIHQIAPWVYHHIQNKILAIRVMEMSSQEIRYRLKNNLCCHHLLPAKMIDYIYKHRLYF